MIFPLLLIGAVYLLYTQSSQPSKSLINIPNHAKHRGVCWVASSREITESEIKALTSKNINWISQTPFGWQSGHDSPEIGGNHGNDNQRGWWGERDEGLRATTRYAKTSGIKTILKPHIWLRDEAGKWRGEIKMKSEEDWEKWFAAYGEFILHYAQLAEEEEIEMLCIGTELHQTCLEREADWRKLIAEIRKVYSGSLTYAANFANEYQDVQFWDDLDYIGIQAYFPLTTEEEASVETLRKGWKQPLQDLEKISVRYNKPVLFTEVGYKSTKDAGIDPWEWPQRLSQEDREKVFSDQTQANCFEALFAEVLDKPWIAGIHIWKWYPGYGNANERRGNQMANIDFTPQQKLAEQVIIKEFGQLKQDGLQ